MISVIRQFHDGMCGVRLDDGVCSGWFAVEQDLRQGCVLAPLLFKIFAAVTHVAYTRFEADKGIMDTLVGSRKSGGGETGGNNGRISCPGDVTMGHAIR